MRPAPQPVVRLRREPDHVSSESCWCRPAAVCVECGKAAPCFHTVAGYTDFGRVYVHRRAS